MKSSDLRNIVLLGHGGTGKTSIAEAMLFNCKAIDRLGKIADGNTTLDYDPEEIKRQVSINMAVAPVELNPGVINIIDTPGYFDFVGEMLEGVSVADSAIIVVAGSVAVGAEKAWDVVNEKKLPRAIVINKMNDETSDFLKIYEELKEKFGQTVIPIQLPIKKDGKLIGYVDTVRLQAMIYQKTGGHTVTEIPADLKDEAMRLHDVVCEVVAESDDALMEKFFAGETFTEKEIIDGMSVSIINCNCTPVLICSALEDLGIDEMVKFVYHYMPAPSELAPVKAKKPDGTEVEIKADSEADPVAFVFKTIADPFVGRLSLFRVYSGTIKGDTTYYNSVKEQEEKFSQLFVMRGKKQIPVKQLVEGDIGAVAKLAVTTTNDTICLKSNPVILPAIEFPKPQITLAISPKTKGDEEKISNGLSKLMDEDPTFTFGQDTETSQQLISGIGEQHIDVITNKLKSKYGVSVDLTDPKIPYRETIRKKVKVEGKHKKQSGGHGQYGHVWIEFEPGEKPELDFSDNVFGGAVPKNFFPAVEKGLQDCIKKGVLAGYPMVNLKAVLVDGSYHPVDSSEMAFKVAASLAYKKLTEAAPTLMEPIMDVKVLVPDRYMGDIIGDLNKRRGRVLGMNPAGKGLQEVCAEVPMAEMFKYATDLRSMTQARGSFTSEFLRYDDVPGNVAQKIIEEAKKNMVDDEE